jgi:hypothetical protein
MGNQLLETGFRNIPLSLLDMRPFPNVHDFYQDRWLIFRIMLRRSHQDTATKHGETELRSIITETQPLAGPPSRWFHFLPHAILKAGVGYNFLAELVAPGLYSGRGWHVILGTIILFYKSF